MIPDPSPLPAPDGLAFDAVLRFQEAVPALQGAGLQVLYAPGERVGKAFTSIGRGPFGSFLLAHAGPSPYAMAAMTARQRAAAVSVGDVVSFALRGVDTYGKLRHRFGRVGFVVVDLAADHYCGLTRTTVLALFDWMHEYPPLTKAFAGPQRRAREAESRELARSGERLDRFLAAADGATLRRWVLRRILAKEMERNW